MEWLTSLTGTFDIFSHLAALAFAYALALPIARDRERQEERSAGLRTFPLVAIAACGFIQATEGITLGNAEATARIIEGLINGVGFIGGGAMLVGKEGTKGTATAASLWATGAIGTSVGLGAYDTAIVLSILTFATLRIMTNFKVEEALRHAKEEGVCFSVQIDPISAFISHSMLAISTWIARRWPGLQRANQVRVAGPSILAL